MSDIREEQAITWLKQQHMPPFSIRLLAGDASFRRYFRIQSQDETWVLMDAPPEKESLDAFLSIQTWLHDVGLRVPQCVAKDCQQGFLLLEDFADDTWAVCLQKGMPLEPLLNDALQQLHALQAAEVHLDLPCFDVPRMQRECDLYLDWYLPKVAHIVPTSAQRHDFHQAMLPILQSLADLPYAPVHLDFHSRNLMLPPQGFPLGVIDFQDAVMGPVSYDLASLLYDCYQDYPESLRFAWSQRFFETLPCHVQDYFSDVQHWHHCLRLTAYQRHLKALGIFARLAYRDGKRQFLDEIPLTQKHLLDEVKILDVPEHIRCLLPT